jgi:hypothetical protein
LRQTAEARKCRYALSVGSKRGTYAVDQRIDDGRGRSDEVNSPRGPGNDPYLAVFLGHSGNAGHGGEGAKHPIPKLRLERFLANELNHGDKHSPGPFGIVLPVGRDTEEVRFLGAPRPPFEVLVEVVGLHVLDLAGHTLRLEAYGFVGVGDGARDV